MGWRVRLNLLELGTPLCVFMCVCVCSASRELPLGGSGRGRARESGVRCTVDALPRWNDDMGCRCALSERAGIWPVILWGVERSAAPRVRPRVNV